MKLFSVPYRWRLGTYRNNLSHIWSDLTHGVANVFRWVPIIWGDHDWDWEYLAFVMEYKLRRSALLELRTGNHIGSERHGKQMLICAELLKRLRQDDYHDNFNMTFGKSRDRINLAEKQAKEDQEMLGRILGKHLRHWWD